MGETRITLIGRPGCHLCDDAEDVVARVASDLGVGWQGVHRRRPWSARTVLGEIPVILVDGQPHTFWRVSEERLRGALTS